MKVVVLNGMREGENGPAPVYEALSGELRGRGYAVTDFELRTIPVAPCAGCFGCWTVTPGECVQKDAGNEIARAVAVCDLLVFFTPVTFGGYSSELKKALDRMIPNLLPHFTLVGGEMHHLHRYPKRPNLLVMGVLSEPDEESEEIFRTLARRNALNLQPPAWAAGVVCSSQPESALPTIRALLARVEAA